MLLLFQYCVGCNHELLLGISISVTFLVTALLSSLLTMLVTWYLCVYQREMKMDTLSEPVLLSNKPFNAIEEESLKMSPKESFGHKQSWSFGVDEITAV